MVEEPFSAYGGGTMQCIQVEEAVLRSHNKQEVRAHSLLAVIVELCKLAES